MKYAPAIKWSGSKRTIASEIVNRLPKHIETYYEPFCGGCSVLRRLLGENTISVKRYVCSDLNESLIGFWNELKQNGDGLADHYSMLWTELNADADYERKKMYFNGIRSRFNQMGGEWYHHPGDFLFIMRTCTNGMPRYNADGEFNNSFHVTRNGIEPDKLRKILQEWQIALNRHEVDFVCRPYWEVEPQDGDLMFLDPPYAGTKGMYFGGFDVERFFEWLKCVPDGVSYALTFDGKAGNQDMTYDVPREVYDTHEYLTSGNSSFRRVIGMSRDTVVHESLYTRGMMEI